MAPDKRPAPVGHVTTWGFAAWVWGVTWVVVLSELADRLAAEHPVSPGPDALQSDG